MFITEDIRRAVIIVFREDYRQVMTELGKSAILHSLSDDGNADRGEESSAYSMVRMISMRLDAIISDITPGLVKAEFSDLAIDVAAGRDYASDEILLKRMQRQYNRYRMLDDIFAKEIASLERKMNEMKDLADLPDLTGTAYFSVVRGRLDGDFRHSAASCYVVRRNNAMLAMCPSGYREEMMAALREAGFEQAGGGNFKQEFDRIERRCEYLRERRKYLGRTIGEKKVLWGKILTNLVSVYPDLEVLDREGTKWRYLKNLVVMNGWIEKKRENELRNILHTTASHGIFINVYGRIESLRSNPPVRLKNASIVKPFESLVKSMGMPGNSEIDPTPLAGIIYMFLFGMMFGDLGQGFVLVLAGILIYMHGKSQNSENRYLGAMLAYCGISTMVWGVLYGSFFSNEHILKAFLFHPSEKIMELFFLAVGAGALCILIALLLNVVNTFMSGGMASVVLEHGALPSLLMYSGGVLMMVHYLVHGSLPGFSAVWILPGSAVFFLVMRGAVGALLLPGTHVFPHGAGEYIVETLADMVEMVSSFVANTISFIRAGAFALSHAGLGYAFYSLASILPGSESGPAGVAVIVTGNIFIILLEGLLCGIQSLRLEYYELFSRFYRGDGVEFSPFRFSRITLTGGAT